MKLDKSGPLARDKFPSQEEYVETQEGTIIMRLQSIAEGPQEEDMAEAMAEDMDTHHVKSAELRQLTEQRVTPAIEVRRSEREDQTKGIMQM